jgi:hypothetical protein
MAKFEQIADYILCQLYEARVIVPRDSIIKESLQNLGSKINHGDLQLALKYLEDQELVSFFPEPGLGNGYLITIKGLLIVKSGGIRRKQCNEKIKSLLYLVSLIAVAIAGVYYLFATIELIRCWK